MRSWSVLRLVFSFPPVLGSGVSLHQITLLMFCLNWWFKRAYTNGLTAELNNTIISTAAICSKLILRVERVLKTYSIDSAPQETAKMKLTVIAIKVTRFRTFKTPCELWEGKGSQWAKIMYWSMSLNSLWEKRHFFTTRIYTPFLKIFFERRLFQLKVHLSFR